MAMTVEELSVTLRADASGYMRSMEEASKSARKMADSVEGAGKRITGLMSTLKSFATVVTGVFGALKLGEFFKEAKVAFEETKVVLDELYDTMGQNIDAWGELGDEVEPALEAHKTFAKEVQAATNVTEKMTLSLLSEAEAMGLMGDQARKAVEGSIGLAKLTGFDADWLLEAVGAAGEGKTEKLEKILPALRGITDQTERLRIAQKFITGGFDEAAKAAQTWEGRLQSLKNEFGSFKVSVGEVVSNLADLGKVLTGAIFIGLKQGLTRLVETVKNVFNAIGSQLRESFDDSLEGLDVSFDGIMRAIENVGAFTKLVLFNLGDIAGGAWNLIEDIIVNAVDGIADALRGAVGWITEFAGGGKQLAISIGLITTAVAGAIIAWKLFNITLAVTSFVLTTLKVQQIASTIAWVAWTAAVVTAKAFTLLFTAIISTANIATAAWTAGLLLEKAALWLVNTALTATNALMLGLGVIAAGLAAGVLVAGFAVLAAAVKAAWQTMKALVELFANLDTAGGPIAHITELFGQWKGIFMDVVKAAKTDLKLAWELLAEGAKLAFSQISDMLEPLWTFIKDGFKATWEFVSKTMILNFQNAIADILKEQVKLLEVFTLMPGGDIFAVGLKAANDALKDYKDVGDELLDQAEIFAQWDLEDIFADFAKDTKPSERTKELTKSVAALREQVANLAELPDDKKKSLWQQIQDMVLGGKADPKAASETREKLKAEAAALTEKFKPPEIKFAETVKHLDELLNLEKGAISWETYTKAVAAARKELHGTAESLKAINGILVGGLEDRLLMFNQAATLTRDDMLPSKPGPAKIPELDMKLIRDWDRLEGLTMGGGKSAVDLLEKIATATETTAEKDPVILEGADIA